MRYVRDQTGRFAERPHYEPKELDVMFEKIIIDFLKAQHGKIEFPITTDDLTVLIERDTEDLDPYADLSVYGNGVEGVTEFMPGRKPRVRIAAALAASENHENRYRTTLTHEYGHVQLHGYLFALGASGAGLFGTQQKPDVIACKRDTMVSAARTDWLEWQAGYACGAALMPATHARMMADAYRKKENLYGAVPATSTHGQALIDAIVETFQVSRDAARVRLSILGFLGTAPAAGSLFG
jgi:IrrE N-terminal-like domain